MNRYAQLLQLIDQAKPETIFEFGTWNGDRAIEMLKAAQKHKPGVQYAGVDLFEDGTAELDAAESNVKAHQKIQDVHDKIKAATNARINVIKANSRDLNQPVNADFVFIDGGHSVDTIRGDYNLSKQSRCIVFDDYYVADENGAVMDTAQFGCNKLVDELKATILPQKDPVFKDGKRCGYVQMAVYPPLGGQEIKVKTKNVGSDHEIQDNIRHALSMYHPFRLPHCRVHDGVALMCAGGPSLEKEIATITQMALNGGTIFAVKSAHDRLIAAGIPPFACILLDPRGHVKEFIDTPHPKVNYIVASMCHPSVFKTLQAKGARAWLYHAAVGAGEQKVVAESYATQGKTVMLAGGCSSATRGVTIAGLLGFRKVHLFGYDLCYDGPGGGRVKIGIKNGRPFTDGDIWTDYEKVAQLGELRAMMEDDTVEIEVHGGAVASIIRDQVPRRQDFCRVFG
jgi:predicted O-methyltransferase YrrM